MRRIGRSKQVHFFALFDALAKQPGRAELCHDIRATFCLKSLTQWRPRPAQATCGQHFYRFCHQVSLSYWSQEKITTPGMRLFPRVRRFCGGLEVGPVEAFIIGVSLCLHVDVSELLRVKLLRHP